MVCTKATSCYVVVLCTRDVAIKFDSDASKKYIETNGGMSALPPCCDSSSMIACDEFDLVDCGVVSLRIIRDSVSMTACLVLPDIL